MDKISASSHSIMITLAGESVPDAAAHDAFRSQPPKGHISIRARSNLRRIVISQDKTAEGSGRTSSLRRWVRYEIDLRGDQALALDNNLNQRLVCGCHVCGSGCERYATNAVRDRSKKWHRGQQILSRGYLLGSTPVSTPRLTRTATTAKLYLDYSGHTALCGSRGQYLRRGCRRRGSPAAHDGYSSPF